MTFLEFTQSQIFSRIIYSIVGLLLVLLIFQAGMYLGFRRAAFSVNWDTAHNCNLRDPRSIFAPFGNDTPEINPHGSVGEILSIRLPLIVVKGISGDEDFILISTSTSIRKLRGAASTSDFVVGGQIVTIGSPDERGQIHASFIRLIPQDTFATDTPPFPLPQDRINRR